MTKLDKKIEARRQERVNPATKYGVTGNKPNNNANLSAEAYQRIKRDIITHNLRPNEKISETSLTERYKLGKAPIRSALARLTNERLVVQRSPRFQIVAPLTFADVSNVIHLRELLEPDALRQAAKSIKPEQIKKLRALNKECDVRYTVGDAESEMQFLNANRVFHVEVARLSENWLQANWIEQLQDETMRIMWVAVQLVPPGKWEDTHEGIITALEKGDGEEAASCMLSHLSKVHATVLRAIISEDRFSEFSLT